MSTQRWSAEELLARARKPSEDAMRLHPLYRGKMQTLPKCPIRSFDDFAIWYSPGVAAPCRAIQAEPDLVYAHTNKACDRKGTLHKGRHDIEDRQPDFADKWRVCRESNGDNVVGGIGEALRGADVCVAFSSSGPGIIKPEWVRTMARDAIVFACANPVPEIWPWEAREAGARIVTTGRSDFPNQLNNSLVFPGLFRGALDARARTITDEMAAAVARELAGFARARGIRDDDILGEWMNGTPSPGWRWRRGSRRRSRASPGSPGAPRSSCARPSV